MTAFMVQDVESVARTLGVQLHIVEVWQRGEFERAFDTAIRQGAGALLILPAILSGWGARGYNWEYAVSGQHELAPRISVSGGWYRRQFGNQTVTVDNRYSIAKGSYDGPFCVNTPSSASFAPTVSVSASSVPLLIV